MAESEKGQGPARTLASVLIKHCLIMSKEPDKSQHYLSGQVHVRDGQNPLCHQVGDLLNLCSRAAFDKALAVKRCRRCERLLGIVKYPWENELDSLSENQRRILIEISHRTKGIDQWCFAADLSENKTDSGRSSLNRSLRRLQRRGYIEKKLNAHNRTLVRLTDRLFITKSGKIYLRDAAVEKQST